MCSNIQTKSFFMKFKDTVKTHIIGLFQPLDFILFFSFYLQKIMMMSLTANNDKQTGRKMTLSLNRATCFYSTEKELLCSLLRILFCSHNR